MSRMIYIIGKNPVLEALRSERDINKIWIAEGADKGQMQQCTRLSKRSIMYCSICTKEKIRSNGRGKSSRSCCSSCSISICRIR